jgi:hypothetical protein
MVVRMGQIFGYLVSMIPNLRGLQTNQANAVPEFETPPINGRSGSFRSKNLENIRFLLASASPDPYSPAASGR